MYTLIKQYMYPFSIQFKNFNHPTRGNFVVVNKQYRPLLNTYPIKQCTKHPARKGIASGPDAASEPGTLTLIVLPLHVTCMLWPILPAPP